MRGVGCFRQGAASATGYQGFPSPCGVWVVSAPTQYNVIVDEFPSPCGVWVVSRLFPKSCRPGCFRPLAGCGLFPEILQSRSGFFRSFRPLAGCGLFPPRSIIRTGCSVSVPLRGVGCFQGSGRSCTEWKGFRPLAGCGLFLPERQEKAAQLASVPLRGVGCFRAAMSEGGVPEVSVPLRGVGCFSYG